MEQENLGPCKWLAKVLSLKIPDFPPHKPLQSKVTPSFDNSNESFYEQVLIFEREQVQKGCEYQNSKLNGDQ